jgi:hypothetical protein
MKKIALASLVLGVIGAAPSAFAQCPPGSWLCADIQIGGTVQTPPPPTVYVQPAPPPVYVVPPPPPRVIVTQAPVVYYQPPPQQVYVSPPRMYVASAYVAPQPRRGYVGIQAQVAGSFMATPSGMGAVGGLGLGLRFRGNGFFGGEVAFNVMNGRDYNGDSRLEVPVGFTGLFYFNPQNRFQVYGLAGFGFSVASVRYTAANRAAHGGLGGADYGYLGAQGGIGAELQLSPRFSLFADVRAFIRGRVDDTRDQNPEFARTLSDGATQTANGSGGVLTQAGAVLYF